MNGFRILLVDDLESLIIILERGLIKQGHMVFSAKSGVEAIEFFNREQIDVVVCDLAMDGLDGWEVGKTIMEICKVRGIPRPPFILMTGWGGTIDHTDRLSSHGIDKVLEKPITIPDLERAILETWKKRSV
jgi:CheY-like chemotaxis protein